jgi:hypothetical protein
MVLQKSKRTNFLSVFGAGVSHCVFERLSRETDVPTKSLALRGSNFRQPRPRTAAKTKKVINLRILNPRFGLTYKAQACNREVASLAAAGWAAHMSANFLMLPFL